MRVLFVSPYIPSPVRVRPYQWIRALARHGHRVRLVALQPPEDQWVTAPPAADCCEQVTVFPLSRTRTLWNAAAAVSRDIPLQAAYSLHPAAERYIASEARQCDVVHVEHLRGSLLAGRVQDTPCVIDAVDSITSLFEQAARQAPFWRQRLMARLDLGRTRRFEAGLSMRFERTLVSSPRDATVFTTLAHGQAARRVVALPNGVDLDYFHPLPSSPEPETVLFSGKISYHANEAAVLELAHRIMPLVWRERPNAQLVIAGKDPSQAVSRLSGDPRITVTGFVEDLRPFFWSATVVVAPLIYGTGIQNKVLEAMACGVPVVASSAACAGIGAPPGRALLVGSGAQEIASHVVALFRAPARRAELAVAGRRYVQMQHDWHQLGRRLIDVYEDAQKEYRRCA
jgi:glycosyltransferase involved in cell wall biosynthesis